MKKFFTLPNSRLLLLTTLFGGLGLNSFAQTNPTARTIPFTENFGTSTFTSAPSGFTSWNGLGGDVISTQALAEASIPSGNATITGQTAATGTGGSFGLANGGNARFYIQESSNATNGVNQIAMAIATTGYTSVVLGYEVEVISVSSRTPGVVCQYRVGTSGAWTTITATTGSNPYSQSGGTTGLKTTVSATLPSACDNQTVVQIRWAFWRGSGSGSSGGMAIDNVTTSGSAGGPSLSGSALTAFGAQCINYGPYGPNSFTITGNALTSANVTVGALSGFSYSTTLGGTYTSSLSLTQAGGTYSQAIFVKFDPTAVASYSGNIAVGGGGASSINVAASGSGINTAPTVTTGTASAITTTSATVAGTLNTATSCGAVTAYGIEYSTTPGFANGAGTPVASTNLSGTAFSSALSGLVPCTVYYTHAYATRAAGTTYGTQSSFTTAVVAAPVATAGTSINDVSFTANWGAVTGATGYQLDVSTLPTFGTSTPGTTTIETFSNMDVSTPGSYNTRAWTGVDGVGWTAYKARADQAMTGVAPTLQDQSGSYLESNAIAGGVSAISFDAKQFFVGGGGVFTVKVLSGVSFATSTTIGTIAYTTSLSSFSQAFADITGPIKIRVENNGVARGGIDNLSFTRATASTPSFVPGYNNLSVAGTTQSVTGLSALTTYYYRVRTVGPSCTSVNSNVITVTTTAGSSPLLTAGALTGFGNVCINTTAGPNSFTISGTSLTTANVTVGALAGFTYSTAPGGTYTSTLSLTQPGGTYSQAIFVKFTPTAVVSYSGNIAVGGGGASGINVAATGSGIDTAPAVTTGTASAITGSSATVAGTLDITGICGAVTAYGIEYSTTPGFTPGTGTPVASTNLGGTAFSSNLSGLAICTPYYTRAYATRASGTTYGAETNFTTPGAGAPTATPGTSIGYTGFTANWGVVAGATTYSIDVSTSPTFGTTAAATDLIISEYVEATGNNKYIELYNGTGATVNLADYTLNLYNNGSASPSSSLVLTGSLTNGSTIVYANAAATIYGGTATTTAICGYNGNDALSLTKTAGGAFVDIFGTIGQNPGAAWTSGGLSTLDRTLARKATVTGGISSNPGAGFPALATEWTGYAIDDVSHLGSHTFNGFIPSYVTGYENLDVGNVTSVSVTGLDPATTYYYRIRTNSCGASDNSNTITVNTLAIPVYYSRATGYVGDDIWSDTPSGTAGPAIFTSASSMVIQSGDVVTNESNTAVNDLTVAGGGTLVLSPGFTLSPSGNADFSGTLTANDNSTLAMVGTGAVTFSGANPVSLFNLSTNVPGGLTTGATINIRGTLLLANGNLNASTGSVTLVSTATGTGRLGPVASGASYTGNITVQRYIPAGHTNWRMLGSPVAGRTVNDWQDDFFTAGYPGSAYPNFHSPVGSGILWPSVRYYNETNTYASADTGVVGVTSNTQALTPGQGFFAWSGSNLNTTTAFTVDVTGAPNVALTPITLPMTYTSSGTPAADGWNLVSNPVPSPIAFDSISLGANVLAQYWIFNPVNGTSQTYSGGIGQGNVNGTIQSSQGFWLQATGSSVTTTVSEADKVNAPAGGVFGGSQQAVRPIVRLFVSSAINTYSDEATLVFDQGTPDHDPIDARKMPFRTIGAPLISARTPEGDNLAIDFFGAYTSAITIPVTVEVGVTGTYTISAGITGMNNLSCLTLEDVQTGTITPLTDGASYSFAINANDDASTARFILHGTAPLAFTAANATCANTPNGEASVVITNGPVDVTWTDAFGTILASQTGLSNVTAINNTFAAGNYMVHVSPMGACGEVTTDFSIAAPALIQAAESASQATSCPNSTDGSVSIEADGGTGTLSYLWSDGTTGPQFIGAAGGQLVNITDEAGCSQSASFSVPAGEGAIAGFTAGTAVATEPMTFANTSTQSTAWAWDFGDGSTSTDENPTHTYATVGTYTVTLTATDGNCTDASTQVITVEMSTAVTPVNAAIIFNVYATQQQLVIDHAFGNAPVDVAVYDATGRLAMSRNGVVKPNTITLPDRELGTGVWFVRVKSGDVERTFRVPLVR